MLKNQFASRASSHCNIQRNLKPRTHSINQSPFALREHVADEHLPNAWSKHYYPKLGCVMCPSVRLEHMALSNVEDVIQCHNQAHVWNHPIQIGGLECLADGAGSGLAQVLCVS